MDYPTRTHDAIVYIDDAEPSEAIETLYGGPAGGAMVVLHSLKDLSALDKAIGCKH